MIKYKIYRAYNKHGKSYIGWCKVKLFKRIYKHYYSSEKGSPYAFHNALKIYYFCWEILEETEKSSEIYELEKKWIKKFDSMCPNGYNMTAGGEGVLGLNCSEKTKKASSERLKKALKDPNSEISKNLEKSKIKVIRSDGKIFSSLKEAADSLNVCHQAIHRVITGDTKIVKGFTFEPLNKIDLKNKQSETRKAKENYLVKLKQKIIDQDGNIYLSISEAAKKLNTSNSNIKRVLRGKYKSLKGYKFYYLDKE